MRSAAASSRAPASCSTSSRASRRCEARRSREDLARAAARGVHPPLPNEVLAPAIAELTPTQLRLLLGLVYCAEFKREGSVSPNGRWRIAQPLGHELALAAAGEQRQVRDELEALVASRGGVERCASWTLATVQSRGPRFRPGSVAWCVKLPARPAAAGRRDLALKRGAASRAASIT